MSHRNQAAVCHALGLCCFFFPFGSIIAPLIWWLIKRDESPYVDKVGRDVINFQLSVALYVLAQVLVIPLGYIVFLINASLLPIMFTFYLGFAIVCIVGYIICMIMAIIRTLNDEVYTYPFTIRFLR